MDALNSGNSKSSCVIRWKLAMIYECGIMVSSDLSIGLCAQARPQICVFMIKEEMSEEFPPAGEELDKVKYPYLSLLMNIDRSRGRFSFRIRRTTISWFFCSPRFVLGAPSRLIDIYNESYFLQ